MARSRALALALLLPLTAVGAACRPAEADAPPPPAPAGAGPEAGKPDPAAAADWQRVDQLISDQKLAEAAQDLEKLEAGARARHDDHELARVLIRETQVGLALGGYETAVEALAAKDWPAAPLARAAVELYQAHALLGYLNAYGWEIARREKVVSGEKLDLKLWTRDQIIAAADRAFADVWSLRADLGRVPAGDFEYLSPNTYPAGIRPTLRDAVAYLWASRLENSSNWTVAEIQETWKLDLPGLIAGTAVEPTAERLSDPGVHPLAKLAAILGDLERWHRSRGDAGAALEARSVRLEDLFFALDEPADRATIRTAFGRSLDEFRGDPWWAMGEARWANLWKDGPEPDAAARAREIALAGERADPGTPGAAACRHILDAIEAPSFDLHSMSLDAAGRRSVAISHRNLGRLWFRAFRLPDERFAERKVAWRGWNEDRIRKVTSGTPAAAWSQELPEPADYREHRSYTTPPLEAEGRYLIVGSARQDFRPGGNRLQAVELTISDLVVERDPAFGRRGAQDSVRVVSGADGAPVAGARAELYRWSWEQKPELLEAVTDRRRRLGALHPDRPGSDRAEVSPSSCGPPTGGTEAVWSQGWGWQTAGVAHDRAGRAGLHRPGDLPPGTGAALEGPPLPGRPPARAADRRGRGAGHRAPDRPQRRQRRRRVGDHQRLRHRVGPVDDPGRPVARKLDPAHRRRRLGLDRGRGVQAAHLRGDPRRTRGRAPAQPAGRDPRRSPLLLRPACLLRPGRLAGDPLADADLRLARLVAAAGAAAHGRLRDRRARERRQVRDLLHPRGRRARTRTRPCGCYRFAVEAEVTDDGGETRSGDRSLALGWVGVVLSVDGRPLPGRTAERAHLDPRPPGSRRHAAARGIVLADRRAPAAGDGAAARRPAGDARSRAPNASRRRATGSRRAGRRRPPRSRSSPAGSPGARSPTARSSTARTARRARVCRP